MTFADYITDMPGLTDFARTMYLRIDAEAERLGKQLVATHYTPEELRGYARKAASPFLADRINQEADAIERDPSGRLAVVPALRAWAAGPDGIGNTWINWWVALYCAWLDGVVTLQGERQQRSMAL